MDSMRLEFHAALKLGAALGRGPPRISWAVVSGVVASPSGVRRCPRVHGLAIVAGASDGETNPRAANVGAMVKCSEMAVNDSGDPRARLLR